MHSFFSTHTFVRTHRKVTVTSNRYAYRRLGNYVDRRDMERVLHEDPEGVVAIPDNDNCPLAAIERKLDQLMMYVEIHPFNDVAVFAERMINIVMNTCFAPEDINQVYRTLMRNPDAILKQPSQLLKDTLLALTGKQDLRGCYEEVCTQFKHLLLLKANRNQRAHDRAPCSKCARVAIQFLYERGSIDDSVRRHVLAFIDSQKFVGSCPVREGGYRPPCQQ